MPDADGGAIEALPTMLPTNWKQKYLAEDGRSTRTAPMNSDRARRPDLAAAIISAGRRRHLPVSGTKIFITWGEKHDVAENIIHLVLARLPDAPAGTEGHLAVPGAEVPGQ